MARRKIVPRYNAKRDQVEKGICRQLDELGINYVRLDFADLLIGWRGKNIIIEIKNPGESLRDDQAQFQRAWGGQYDVAHSIDEVLAVLELHTVEE